MRTFSRNMPPIPTKKVIPWWALAVSLVGILYGTWKLSWGVFAIAVSFIGFVAAATVLENRRLRHLATERSQDSICTFAREFDLRLVDPWIIRAVYEGLQDHFEGNVARFPFRPTDNLVVDLKIDEEDLDDLIAEIAGRIGRSMQGIPHNPLSGRVKTVRDLVLFYVSQPKLNDA